MNNHVVLVATKYFEVCLPSVPHIDRKDGGHIFIRSKRRIPDRTFMTQKESDEFIKLTMVCGEAMKFVMEKSGIPIENINYQENGNWCYLNNEKPWFHMHLYGRARNSVNQKFGQALYLPGFDTGFYDGNRQLREEETKLLVKKINEIWRKKMSKIYFKNKNGEVNDAKLIHSHINEEEHVQMYYLDNVDETEVEKIANEIKSQETLTQLYVRIQFAVYGWLIIVSEANE